MKITHSVVVGRVEIHLKNANGSVETVMRAETTIFKKDVHTLQHCKIDLSLDEIEKSI